MTDKKREWQCGDTATIHCINLAGQNRTYKFKIMNQKTGTMLFHQYLMLAAESYDTIQKFIVGFQNGEAQTILESAMNALDLIKYLPRVLKSDDVKTLAKYLLADHVLTIPNEDGGDDEIYQAGEDGFCGIIGDPLEIYCAIFWAVRANYSDYVDPFLNTLTALMDGQGVDGLTQDLTE